MHGLAASRVRAGDHELVDELLDGDVLGNVLGARAVVGEENDERVVEDAVALERLQDAPDALVHAVDLRGVDLHAAQEPRLVIRILPRRLRRIARRQLPAAVQDAPLDEPVEALLAQPVPALVEAAAVLRDVLVVRVQRPMRRGVCHVLEERRSRVVALVLVEEGDRLVADRVGVEEAGRARLVLDVIVAARERVRIVEAAGADDRAVELVEAALQRPGVGRLHEARCDVPLAAHVGAVAVALQRLRDRGAAMVEVAGVAFGPRVVREDAHAGLVRMESREHRCPRRAASRRVVELREAQAVRRQAVEVGRLDLAAVAADVREAHVVVEDQHDVRLFHSRIPVCLSKTCAAAGANDTCTRSPSCARGRRSLFCFNRCSPATKLTIALSPRSSTRSTRAGSPVSAMRRSPGRTPTVTCRCDGVVDGAGMAA